MKRNRHLFIFILIFFLANLILGVPASAVIQQGVDTDGDIYQIQLLVAGTIVDPNLTNLTLTGTTSASILTIAVIHTQGDGKVNVARLNTNSRNLGSLKIDGDLSILQCGSLGTLDVETIGAVSSTNTITIGGAVNTFKVTGKISNATINVAGNVLSMTLGQSSDTGTVVSHSAITVTGNVTLLNMAQSLTAGSTLNIGGQLLNATFGDSIVNSTVDVDGAVTNARISGGILHNSRIVFDGTCQNLTVSKNISDATVTIGSKLSSARFESDVADSVMVINQIDSLTIGDDLNDTRLRVSGDLKRLQVGDIRRLILGVSGKLGQLQVMNDLDEATIFTLDNIDSISILGDMNRSTVVAGIDLGDDLVQDPNDRVWGNAWIKNVQISGNMIDSNLSAGVDAGAPNYQFGDGDDVAVNNHSGTSRILRVMVLKQIKSTQLPGETYAISADDGVDSITAGGRSFSGVPGVILQEF